MFLPHAKFLINLTAEGLRPSASDLPRPWVFQQLPGKVLMAILSQKHIFYLFNFWENAFNLWKQVLLRKVFTYGYHDNARQQQFVAKKQCLHNHANIPHYVQFTGKVHFIYEKCLITKLFTYGCHDTVQVQHTRATNKGIKPNTLFYALCWKKMSRYYYGNII